MVTKHRLRSRFHALIRLLVLIGWLASLLIIAPRQAFACSCLQMQGATEEQLIEMDIEGAAAVFAGKVSTVQANALGGYNPVRVSFTVSEVWKGDLSSNAIIFTGLGDSDCGYDFQIGQEYLVYARDVRGVLNSGICYRTTLLSSAAADLSILGEGTIPATSSAPLPTNPILPIGAGILIAILLLSAIFILTRRFSRKSMPD